MKFIVLTLNKAVFAILHGLEVDETRRRSETGCNFSFLLRLGC